MEATAEEMTPAQQRMAHARAARKPPIELPSPQDAAADIFAAAGVERVPPLIIRSACLLKGALFGGVAESITVGTDPDRMYTTGMWVDSITPHALGILVTKGDAKALIPWARVVSAEVA